LSLSAWVRNHLRRLPDLRMGYRYITAEVLGITVDDLKYRLRKEGASYQRLLMAERRRRLERLLEEVREPALWEVAEALGYSHISSARIALKMWGPACGVSGKTDRKQVVRVYGV